MSDPVYHGVENKLKVVVDVLGNAEEWHKEPAARYAPQDSTCAELGRKFDSTNESVRKAAIIGWIISLVGMGVWL